MAPSIAEMAAQAQANNEVYPLPRPTDNTTAWRLEIDEFLADNAMTNLFLLALGEMQAESITSKSNGKDNWWSFYSLSAIHGEPRESWLEGKIQSQKYCHHGMTTFPTWHRAYMFQMEQAVYNKMVQIAKRYPDDFQKDYLDAASRFRLPYWDPIMPRYKDDSRATPNAKAGNAWFWGIPQILRTPNVFVRYPDKAKELTPMPNPLYQFTFPGSDAFSGSSRSQIKWDGTAQGWEVGRDADGRLFLVKNSFDAKRPNLLHTVRGPTKDKNSDSDYSYLEEAVQLQARNLATYTWQLLTPVDEKGNVNQANVDRSWDFFASHTWYDQSGNKVLSSKTARSLESWHDNLHTLIGTGRGFMGHMSNPAIAAFDPIFWLHHNNIERLLCLYQSIYPDKFVKGGKRDWKKEPAANNDDINIYADDELFPFRKDASKKLCFTSTDLRDWTKSGFATPGDQNVAGVSDKVKQYLRDTYYWATEKTAKPDFEKLKFPKNFDRVEALTGKPEPTGAKQVISMKAITVQDGQAALVARSVSMSLDDDVSEQVIDPSQVAVQLKKREQDYPEGALIDVNADTATKMNTWNAHFRIKKYAYDGSFNIHFFIGDIESARPENYMVRMNEVGFSGIFASSKASDCKSCEDGRRLGLKYEDVVPLTNTVQDYLESDPKSARLITSGEYRTIRDMSPEEVVPFLKQNLRWRMTDTSGQVLPYLPDSELEVVVAGRMFIPPQGDNLLGTYGSARAYAQITAGKSGGYSGPDYDMA